MRISDNVKPFLEEEFTIFDAKAIVRGGAFIVAVASMIMGGYLFSYSGQGSIGQNHNDNTYLPCIISKDPCYYVTNCYSATIEYCAKECSKSDLNNHVRTVECIASLSADVKIVNFVNNIEHTITCVSKTITSHPSATVQNSSCCYGVCNTASVSTSCGAKICGNDLKLSNCPGKVTDENNEHEYTFAFSFSRNHGSFASPSHITGVLTVIVGYNKSQGFEDLVALSKGTLSGGTFEYGEIGITLIKLGYSYLS